MLNSSWTWNVGDDSNGPFDETNYKQLLLLLAVNAPMINPRLYINYLVCPSIYRQKSIKICPYWLVMLGIQALDTIT